MRRPTEYYDTEMLGIFNKRLKRLRPKSRVAAMRAVSIFAFADQTNSGSRNTGITLTEYLEFNHEMDELERQEGREFAADPQKGLESLVNIGGAIKDELPGRYILTGLGDTAVRGLIRQSYAKHGATESARAGN